MYALIGVIDLVLHLYTWVVFIYVIMGWLVQFKVINPGNQFVATVGNTLHLLVEPVLRPIRRFMPNLGGMDISPVILIIVLWFLRTLIVVDVGNAIR